MTSENKKSYFKIAIILLMGAFGMMGGSLIAPGLAGLAQPFQVDEAAVGIVLSVLTISAALTLPFTGLLIDVLGRRYTALSCLVINGFFGMACIFATSFPMLLAFRFFQGIGIAALIPIAMTIVSDMYKGAIRLKMIGFLSGTISASQIIVPSLGGLLAYYNWRYPFIVYSLSLLLAVLFFIFVKDNQDYIEDKKSKKQQNIRQYLHSIVLVFKYREIREVFIHSFTLYYSLYTISTFVPLLISIKFGATSTEAGLALALHGFIAVIFSLLAHKLSFWFNWRLKVILGFSFIVLSLVTLPYWSNLTGVFFSMILYGIGIGLTQPAIFNRVTAKAPDNTKGLVVALFNSMKYLGMTLAPLTLRFVYTRLGFNYVFFAASLFLIIWILVFGYQFSMHNKNNSFQTRV